MDPQVALRMNDLGVEGALDAGAEAVDYAREHGAPLPLGLLVSSLTRHLELGRTVLK